METKRIIRKCKQGNSVAQGVLYNMFYNQMYNLSMRILSKHQDVEDVLSIAFTRVFNRIERFEYRGELSLCKWVKTIVVNESIRLINRKKQIVFDDEIVENNQIEIETDIDSDLIDPEQVYAIIENMPDGYRMVFNLFAIEGYSHKEISELLSIAENTSKSQLRKARLHIISKINKN